MRVKSKPLAFVSVGILLVAIVALMFLSLMHRVRNTTTINHVCVTENLGARTTVSFTWPHCSTFDVVLGIPRTATEPDRGRLLIYEGSIELLVADFDVKKAIVCNWLEKYGIDGRILTLTANGQKVRFDSILKSGKRYKCVVELTGRNENDISLWFVYTQKWKYRNESMGIEKL
jgi:hypothetical protein